MKPALLEIGVENNGIIAGDKVAVGDGVGEGLLEELAEGVGVGSTTIALPDITDAPTVSFPTLAVTVK